MESASEPKFTRRGFAAKIPAFIPAAVVLALIITAILQMEDIDPYPLKSFITIGVAAVCIVLGMISPKIGKIPGTILLLIAPAASFLLLEWFTHNPFDIKSKLVGMNLILFYFFYAALLAISGSIRFTVIAGTAVPMLFGIINYFTLDLRGVPVFPWDFASAGIAATVVWKYTFLITWDVALIIALYMLIIELGALTEAKVPFTKLIPARAIALVTCVLVLYASGTYIQSNTGVKKLGLYPYLFTPHSVYNRNGAAVAMVYSVQFASIDKPAGYTPGAVESGLEKYGDSASDAEKKPNVIVIMNEAFSDLRTLDEFETTKPVTPYIDALEDNTVKGTLHVSVKGGNTANTEFEFLTGLSMAFFPQGSIPYQQYVKGETPSLVNQFTTLGYRTVGMHPYIATGWDRDKVYPWFGFSEVYFREAFGGGEKLRNYFTDKAMYEKIIDMYESDESDDPLFLFGVTMQNHGGYDKLTDDFVPEAFIPDLPEDGVTNVYLKLMNVSDSAFGYLVDYFREAQEDTIILMFGDHQPNDNVVNPITRLTGNTVKTGTLEEQLRRYTVPFVIWANYDIKEETGIELSANYLSSYLFDVAGLPKSPLQGYLSELRESYPVISADHYADGDGYHDMKSFGSGDDLALYKMISYNLISDRNNIAKVVYNYNK